jgi:tetratricopeptide (TPR) repeat protein
MLFDLRGSGRRNTVRAIYLGLAILMGAGLVLFGIGGATSGGLLDAIQGNSGGSTDNTFEKRVAALEKKVKTNPQDEKSWAALARAYSQEASAGDNYDQAKNTFTDKGLAKLKQAGTAWEKYLALDPKPVDPDIANVMVQAYGSLGDYDKATTAMEYVTDARPKQYALWAQLAQLAYFAGQSRKGDLAKDRAIKLAPKDQKETVKSSLESAQQQALQAQIQEQQSAAPPVTTTG